MPDRRTEASRARAVAMLVIEKHRLAEAIADEEEAIETCKLLGIPPVQIVFAERRLALLRDELAEIQPSRRLVATDAEQGEPDAP
jgi:hypothetical protein